MRSVALAFAAAFAVCFVAACGESERDDSVPRDFEVSLERGECFGPCPIYTLSADASGLVRYNGAHFVAVRGIQEAHTDREHLLALIDAIQTANFFTLDDDYTRGQRGCPEAVTDTPYVITSVRLQGTTKTVVHDHGCIGSDVLQRLDRLERKIDELLGTVQWVPCGPMQSGDYSQCIA